MKFTHSTSHILVLCTIIFSVCFISCADDCKSGNYKNIGASSSTPVLVRIQGFGASTVAGRRGKIIKVTNLNDFGPGSFREAVQASGPRIIVFEVGGELNLKSLLYISNPYMTIAGQTAPAPGITLTGRGLRIATYEILMQHIFVRHTASVFDEDAIDIRSSTSPLYNIVIDHVSVAFGDDENISFNPGSGNTRDNNVTFSNNLIAEATGYNGGHNYGTLIAAGSKKFSAIGNLWMSHKARQPRVNGNVMANIVNNVSYNIGSSSHSTVGSTHGRNHVNYVGNQFIGGPNTLSNTSAIAATADIVSGSELYLSDNVINPGTMTNHQITSCLVMRPAISLDGISVLPSRLVLDHVMSNAGARPGERDGIINNGIGDPTDERFVNELRVRAGSLKTVTPSMSAIPSTRRPFYIPANPHEDDKGNGYSNIEEVLYLMALEVEGK